jgi:DNA-binding transcriptional MerR regulator
MSAQRLLLINNRAHAPIANLRKRAIDIDVTSTCTITVEGGNTLEYTVQRLADLAGVSPRTLRYYDKIGLLKPARLNPSGYRVYGQAEVEQLQQILFYRELGVSLAEIKDLIHSPSFDPVAALREHRQRLIEKRDQLDQLISNVDKTIAASERRVNMSDKERFAGFKKQMVEENERKYGQEIREKYTNEVVDQSNQKLLGMSEKQYQQWEELSSKVMETLKVAFTTKDPSSELAQKAADLHRQWLSFCWPTYTKEAHAGLACMYVEDERFKEFYDKEQSGLAEFLKEAILIYTKTEQ